jgi:hypothetical protein
MRPLYICGTKNHHIFPDFIQNVVNANWHGIWEVGHIWQDQFV